MNTLLASGHRRRVDELNGIILASIHARRARRAEVAASLAKPALAASTASSGAPVEEDLLGAQLASGAGAGLSASGQPIFAGGCDMLDVLLDDPTITDSQARLIGRRFSNYVV